MGPDQSWITIINNDLENDTPRGGRNVVIFYRCFYCKIYLKEITQLFN